MELFYVLKYQSMQVLELGRVHVNVKFCELYGNDTHPKEVDVNVSLYVSLQIMSQNSITGYPEVSGDR
ncbi:hypothetical protein H6P81_012791 [Aristolochia fimbriata]|uniref:Uncharacterized protein n=1 Tax=Aristolochia fimbriata TaxID=158543 RepID=A0AAV7ECW2_ARIFI|nr:hypothetical protein H6P81_012791 [Aristolochia fimbriata]